MLTTVAEFTMRRGRVPGALRLIRAVERQAREEQPGTLVYLAHRVLDSRGRPTRRLCFYECYRNKTALKAHLHSSSWRAVEAEWTRYFEGASSQTAIKFFGVGRIAAFERPGAIPVARASAR